MDEQTRQERIRDLNWFIDSYRGWNIGMVNEWRKELRTLEAMTIVKE